jgi:hypothetical protein
LTVIVALAAWLYIIEGLLGLGSLIPAPFRLGGGLASFATLLVCGAFAAMGYGLLKRETWARWLALGISLLSWALGSLMLLGILVALAMSGGKFLAFMFSSGGMAIIAVIAMLSLLIMIVSVVINFKLFFHLCSREGCEEFGVPYGSAGTVVASIGAWLAIFVAQIVMAGGGSGGLALLIAQQALSRDRHRETRAEVRAQAEAEAERRESMRRRTEQQRLREQQSQQPQQSNAREEQAADVPGSVPEVSEPAPPPQSLPREEARAPILAATQEEEKTSPNQILKCRDSSGAVMFTQGYCPPGMQRVEMPKPE